MNSDLCAAIHHRCRIQFGYEPGTRIVEPYAYGVGDGDHELLRAYQISGDSFSRDEGWKLSTSTRCLTSLCLMRLSTSRGWAICAMIPA